MDRALAHRAGLTCDNLGKLRSACEPYSVLSADVSCSTTALVAVPGLSVALDGGSLYRFEFMARFQSPITTTGAGFGVTGPTSPEFLTFRVEVQTGHSSVAVTNRREYNLASAGTAVDAADSDCLATVFGLIKTTAAGNLTLMLRSEIADSPVTIKSGSCAFVFKVV